MAAKAPDPIDKHVGSQVRMRRLMLGMSQGGLADQLGLTFQQVQKYEKGTNRISASRLKEMSQILQVPVPFFFEGVPQTAGHVRKGATAPLELYLSEDLLRYIADEANKRDHSLGDEIVRRLLDSRAQDARQAVLQQVESTAVAIESTMDAVQRLLTLVKPVDLPELDRAERLEKRS